MMEERAAIAEIDATLKNIGFRDVGPGPLDYEGSISVHGMPVSVHIRIPDARFATLPTVQILDRAQIPVASLGHLEADDRICFAPATGLPLDMYRPGEGVLRVLEDAAFTLERSYAHRGDAEIVAEFSSYWHPDRFVRVLLPRAGTPGVETVHALNLERPGDRSIVAVSKTEEVAGFKVERIGTARFMRLAGNLVPVDGLAAPVDMAALRGWLERQPALSALSFDTLVEQLVTHRYILFAAPNALVGVAANLPPDLKRGVTSGKIRRVAVGRVASKHAERLTLSRVTGTWSGIDNVIRRNMAERRTLEGIDIALVGCGTIGGHLAKFLAQSGAGFGGRFTLFDKDRLSDGNLGRHLLGFGDVGKFKATAVQAELVRFHPQMRATAIDGDALGHWPTLRGHELIIDATGDWNIQSVLNDRFLRDDGAHLKALLHSWVFMNGSGVQTFLNLRDGEACFRCLKPIFDESWRYPVSDDRNPVTLQPATCGDGAFIAFSVDIPVSAAALANRVAIDWVNGRPGPRLRSEVTDLQAGRMQKPVSPKVAPACPACAHLR